MKPKLEYASHGPYVSEAQAKLNLRMPGAPGLAVDGKYGSKTVQRVKEFQTSRALSPDGIVGKKTWAALDSGAPVEPGGKEVPKSWTPPPGGTPKSGTPPQYDPGRVPNGALVFCPYGAGPSQLHFNDPSRTVAVIKDCVAYKNVMPFGTCSSMANPAVAAAVNASMGVLTPQPCIPMFVGQWSPGTPLKPAGKPPSTMLDVNSGLMCQWGGIIQIG